MIIFPFPKKGQIYNRKLYTVSLSISLYLSLSLSISPYLYLSLWLLMTLNVLIMFWGFDDLPYGLKMPVAKRWNCNWKYVCNFFVGFPYMLITYKMRLLTLVTSVLFNNLFCLLLTNVLWKLANSSLFLCLKCEIILDLIGYLIVHWTLLWQLFLIKV